MTREFRYSLLEAIGVEVEYMIVDRDTLAVRPIADELLRAAGGELTSELDRGGISWSNELALHLVEFKTSEPVGSLDGLDRKFGAEIAHANELLERFGARLLPTAMHPLMDPHAEFRRWPHDYGPVYEALDRIFDCRGHGWANLQSAHVNLSFGDDEEFGRLHAAIRLVLPLLPALAASSPLVEGVPAPFLDHRLEVYRTNARLVPSVSGSVIPEPVFTRGQYEGVLLQGIYDDLAPLDPHGILRYEWVNARGCIARFDRGSIEIRVLDVQECPAADLAVIGAATALVRALADGRAAGLEAQRAWPVDRLAPILWRVARDADRAVIDDAEYLRLWGHDGDRATAGELWAALTDRFVADDPFAAPFVPHLRAILRHGPLARRIREALGASPARADIEAVYRELAGCLAAETMFRAAP